MRHLRRLGARVRVALQGLRTHYTG